MTEYTSIRVTVDAKENAEASKRDGETWNEYLQRCTDNPPEVREYVELGDLRDRLANDKPDNMSWSAFLSTLHSDGEIPVEDTPETTSGLAEGDVRRAVREVVESELSHEQLNKAIIEQSQKLDSLQNTLENMGGR